MTPSSDVIILDEGGSDEVLYTVVEGNPPSNLVVSGPLQPGNGRVNFTSTGVYMNQVNMGDNGIHTATWSNAAGMTEFTLTLLVNGKMSGACFPRDQGVVYLGAAFTHSIVPRPFWWGRVRICLEKVGRKL